MKVNLLGGAKPKVFSILKFLTICFFLPLLFAVEGYSQTHTSKDNYAGDWYAGSTWVSGTSPGNFPNAAAFNLYGYVRIESGGLTINNNSPTFTIYDTLYITGDFRLGQGSLTVQPGGLLVVIGDFYGSNGLGTFTNNGNIVVTGNVNVSNGHIVNNSNFYTFGSTTTSGGGSIGGCFPWQPCSPADAANFGDETDLENDNPILADFVDNLGVLPVELLHFYPEKNDLGVTLHWATATELNFDRFVVEKTLDGKTFVEIGSVQGAGTSVDRIDYSFQDNDVMLGRAYYRLKAIDFDGYTEYFGVVTVLSEGRERIQVVPNPSNGTDVKIQLNFSGDDAIHYKIVNASGKAVCFGQLQLNGFDSQFKVDESLASGLYFLIVNRAQKQEIIRFVVN